MSVLEKSFIEIQQYQRTDIAKAIDRVISVCADNESLASNARFLKQLFDAKDTNSQWWLDQQIVQAIDFKFINTIIKQREEQNITKQESEEAFIPYIRFFCVATGGVIPDDGLYAQDEIVDIVNGKMDKFSAERFVYTIRQGMFSDDKSLLLLSLLNLWKEEGIEAGKEYRWDDMVCMILALNTLWFNISHIPKDKLTELFRKYYLVAIAAGVPVEKHLTDFFSAEQGYVENYIRTLAICVEALEQNEEVLVLLNNGKKETLPFVTCIKAVREIKKQGGFELNQKMDELMIQYPWAKLSFNSIREACFIYIRLRTATIADTEQEDPTDLADNFERDLFMLFYQWKNKEMWPEIATYYRKKNPLVPLILFLHHIYTFVDLNQPGISEFVMTFEEYMKESGKFPVDQSFIEYQEKDGKFHWSEAVVNGTK